MVYDNHTRDVFTLGLSTVRRIDWFLRRLVGYALPAAVLMALLGPGAVRAEPPQRRWAEGHILVQPKAGLSQEQFEQIVRAHGGQVQRRLRGLSVHVVQVPPQAEEAVARALSHNPHIEFAEPDELIPPDQTIPNDPDYPNAWHLPKILAPDAWDFALGDGVTVAVLDSGVDGSHPDLAANLVAGWNVVSDNSDTSPVTGHGTKVAGVIGALSNNATGVASIAWDARIMPVRITNRSDGWAYWGAVAEGITWAADHGAKVANISYNPNGSTTVMNAAQYMRNKGGLVVTAAGNDGQDPGWGQSSSLIAVAATTSSDTNPSWSNFGDYVDLAAPGVGIWTTTKGGGYGAPSGTSFSSPTTAGVVALVMSANGQLSPDEVETVVEQSAHDLGSAGWDPHFGYGRVDAAAAVQLAMNAIPSDTQAPAVNILAPAAGATVSGLVDVSVSATDNFGVSRVELYADGSLVGTDTLAPFDFSWDSTAASNGDVTLVAYAYDEAGNRGRSAGTTVTVDNATTTTDLTPPSVSIVSPAADSTVSGTVQLSASATDDVQVAEVKIYVDGSLRCVGGADVSCGWNTRKDSAGSHSISAVAKDAAGNTGSAAINVTVGGKQSGPSTNNGQGKAKGKNK
jgi:thermitase